MAYPINDQLLNKARAAATRLAHAEGEVEAARAEYHAVVRRIHLAGAPLRDIAQELGLSHQRVQQIVDAAGGSWWRRVWRSRNATRGLACTFCGHSADRVARLIAGPRVFICSACVTVAERTLDGPPLTGNSMMIASPETKSKCSFCGKPRIANRAVIKAPSANVCSECLRVCRQIITDSEE
jgi:ClpX C4-type zinc finger protein